MSQKKKLYRDKSLGHEKGEIATGEHKSNVGDELATRQQGTGANAFAGKTTVHLQPKPQAVAPISREASALSTRVRKPDADAPEGQRTTFGSRVTSDPPTMGVSGGSREEAERQKQISFGYDPDDVSRIDPRQVRRGNPSDQSRVPRREVSHDRDWNKKQK